MDSELNKIRGHFNGTQADVAKLLDAIESGLRETGTELNPTSYFLAIVSTLISISSSSSVESFDSDSRLEQKRGSLLDLLSIVIRFVNPQIIKSQRQPILLLVRTRLNQLIGANPSSIVAGTESDQSINQHLLRSIISILTPIYKTYDEADNDLDPSQRAILALIIPLTLSHQPKLRKTAQGFITSIIKLDHFPQVSQSLLESVNSFTTHQLQQLLNDLNHSQSDRSNTLIISLIHFIQSFASCLSADQTKNLITILIAVPKQSHNQFLTCTALYSLGSIFEQHTKLDNETLLFALKSIITFAPKDEKCLPSWLNALQNAWATLSRSYPSLCFKELTRIGRIDDIFHLFSTDHGAVCLALKNFFVGIVRDCISEGEILEVYNLPDGDLQSLEFDMKSSSTLKVVLRLLYEGLNSNQYTSNGANIEILEILNVLVLRLRGRPPSDSKNPLGLKYAPKLLKSHVLLLDRLRSNQLSLRASIDQSLSKFSEVCGSSSLLEILPINLFNHDSTSNGRAWLLTVLKNFNTELDHFKRYFIPLVEELMEKKKETLSSSKDQQPNSLVNVKIYDTLIEQIWKLLPGYCDLPVDLITAFDRPFAELLTEVIYTQPSLRPPIFNSLKILVDKNLRLSQNKSVDVALDFNEFGFDPATHVDHLQKYSSNFLSVLLNVYNREQSNQKNPNRGFMVDTISSFLEILPDNDLKITYTKVKTMLAQSLNSKSKTENTKQFLDILLILLPKLTSSTDTIQELQTILTNQSLLNNQALNIQKLGFKLLTKFLEAIVAKGEVSKLKDLDGFLDQILSIEKFGKILPSAKKDRAQLLMSSISLIPNDKLHFIPKLLAEVVLGCKESNSETRYISYETLNKLGHKIQNLPGSFKLDWSALTDEDMAIDSSCEVNLEEYFKMISAGLAGQSPHMISATISALSRVLFEFNSQLKPATITELISTIEVFLKSSNREISKSAIGFVKVAITVLPKSLIEPELANLIPNLLIWTEEHKNFFRTNLMNLFKKLAKKFGIESIEKYAGDEKNCSESSKKFLNGLKKQIKKSKKKKGQVIGDEKNGSDDSSDDEFTKKPVRVKLNDAYEEVLYGSSDNESDSTEPSTGEDNKPRSKRDKKRSSKKGENDSKIMIEDEEDELMDLLEGPSKMTNRLIAGKLARVDKNKRELPNKFKNDKSGKLLIVEDDTKRQIKKKGPEASSDLNAYLEAINGEDGFRRTAQGKIKFNKRKKQGDHHRLDEVENELSELRVEDSKSSNSNVDQKNKRVKKFVEKETLGAEFKAKRAGGDMIKKTADGREIKPFGYLPMRNLNGKMRKNNQIKGGLKNLEIVGRKKKNKSNS